MGDSHEQILLLDNTNSKKHIQFISFCILKLSDKPFQLSGGEVMLTKC